MADVLVDGVHDTTTTGGTGAQVMLGVAPDARKTVAEALSDGQTATFLFEQGDLYERSSGCSWNEGTSTLSRGTVIESSTGSHVAFTAGVTIDVMLIQDASQVLSTAGFTMSGAIGLAPPVTIAAATTPAIFAAGSNNIILSGTGGPVTGFDTAAAGIRRRVRSSAAHTYTHGANLILKDGVNWVMEAGDIVDFISDGAGVTRMENAYRVASASAAEIRAGTTATKNVTPKGLADAAAEVTLTYASSYTPDLTTFINAAMTLTGNLTFNNPSAGMTPGKSGFIRFIQDGTGSRTIAFGTQWDIAGGAPTASTAAGTVDGLAYVVISASVISGVFSKAFA